jgi:hypothetical protein
MPVEHHSHGPDVNDTGPLNVVVATVQLPRHDDVVSITKLHFGSGTIQAVKLSGAESSQRRMLDTPRNSRLDFASHTQAAQIPSSVGTFELPPVFAEDRRRSSQRPNSGMPAFLQLQVGPPSLLGGLSSSSGVSRGAISVVQNEVVPTVPIAISDTSRVSTSHSAALALVAYEWQSTLLKNQILDTAFQDYVLRLPPLAATSHTSHDAALDLLDHEPVTTVVERSKSFNLLDEWTLRKPFDVLDDILTSEQDAVDEVLASLHDVDSLCGLTRTERFATRDEVAGLPSIVATDILLPNRWPDEQAPDGMLQGGMILLRAAGDANESDFSLVATQQGDTDSLSIPLGLEASIGLHQAFDVAADGLPSDSSLPPAGPLAPLPREEAENAVQTETETPSNQPLAMVVGTTAVAGTGLWIRRRPRQENRDRIGDLTHH